MQIPALFLGTAKDARNAVKRLLTQLVRGASLQQAFETAPLTRTEAHPEALLWTTSSRPRRASDAVDFRIHLLGDGLWQDGRISPEHARALMEGAAAFLESTPWGTVVLNANHGHWTGHYSDHIVPCRQSRLAVIRGTYRHWETLMGLGARYCSGQGPQPFNAIAGCAYAGALASVGVRLETHASSYIEEGPFGGPIDVWEDPRPAIEQSDVIARLESDDDFWASIVRKEYGPLPTPENLLEIRELCRGGTSKSEYWDLLQSAGGPQEVEDAVGAIRQRGDWSRVLSIYMHELQDMERAVALFEERSEDPELQWAQAQIADYQAERDPEGAAELLFRAAESGLELGKKSFYRAAARQLQEARDLLMDAGLPHVWDRGIAAYRDKHKRRRNLLRILDDFDL